MATTILIAVRTPTQTLAGQLQRRRQRRLQHRLQTRVPNRHATPQQSPIARIASARRILEPRSGFAFVSMALRQITCYIPEPLVSQAVTKVRLTTTAAIAVSAMFRRARTARPRTSTPANVQVLLQLPTVEVAAVTPRSIMRVALITTGSIGCPMTADRLGFTITPNTPDASFSSNGSAENRG